MMSRRMACRVVAVLLAVAAAVPVGTATAAPGPPPPAGGRALTGPASPATAGRTTVACAAGRGPHQRQVERWLRLTVDGRQSAADCEAVRAFQAKHGIRPANGYAGPRTWARMRLLSAQTAHTGQTGPTAHTGQTGQTGMTTGTTAETASGMASGAETGAVSGAETGPAGGPAADVVAGPATGAGTGAVAAGCPVRSYRVACVDLRRQLTWVQKGGKTLFGPVAMRSGGAGHRTRTGWFRIYWKHKNHWSSLYNAPMPYAQFFSGGQAFHAVYGSIHTTGGSMGCVNLRLADARKLWGVLKTRDHVYVWGRRPGS
ncbi:L,D-transpeptidase family protein [Streptomyces sp. NPDC005385]|uniref:L,D-transpeptidase family protein n=1 Tax=Streptomyces sp. NPDC005385 TaxID=3157039 RepID=UPI0033B3A55B